MAELVQAYGLVMFHRGCSSFVMCVQDGVEFLVYPDLQRNRDPIPSHLLEELSATHGLIYVMDLDNTTSTDKVRPIDFMAGLLALCPPVLHCMLMKFHLSCQYLLFKPTTLICQLVNDKLRHPLQGFT